MKLMAMVLPLAAMLSCLSCSDSESADNTASFCTKPILDANTALATVEGQAGVPVTKMIFIDPGPAPTVSSFKPITFSAEVRSEDRDKPLMARVIVDFQVTANPVVGGGDSLEPSTCADVRTIQAQLTPYQLAQLGGCHQVALVVTHTFDNKTLMPAAPDDVAFLVWWILIEHESTTPAATCPPGGSTAGNDGG